MIATSIGYQIATVALFCFIILGAFDGIYFHIIKYQLYKHPPARFEHFLHTFRGVLFVPITLIFFVWNSAGSLLWLGLLLLLIDLVAEIIDIFVEKQARQELGGISPFESVIHITATGFRMAALAIVIALKPYEAYSWFAMTSELAPLPVFLSLLGTTLITGLVSTLLLQTIRSIFASGIGKSKYCFVQSCKQ